MSTRLRVIHCYASNAAGGLAVQNLEYLFHKVTGSRPPARASMPEAKRIVQMYEGLNKSNRGTLYMFREPRKVSFARSRFKQICKVLGILQKKPKKVRVNEPITRGARGGAGRGVIASRVWDGRVWNRAEQQWINVPREAPIAPPDNLRGLPTAGDFTNAQQQQLGQLVPGMGAAVATAPQQRNPFLNDWNTIRWTPEPEPPAAPTLQEIDWTAMARRARGEFEAATAPERGPIDNDF